MAHYESFLLVAVSLLHYYLHLGDSPYLIICLTLLSSHPLLATQKEVIIFLHLSFLFLLPQTKYLLPHLFNTAFVRSLCHTTSFSAFKHFSCLPPVMLTNNCAALRLLCAAVLTYLLGLFDSGCCLSLAEFTVCRVLK